MKVNNKLFKATFIVAIFTFLLCIFPSKVGAALYDESKNRVVEYNVSRKENKLDIKFEFQFGIKDIDIYICARNEGQTSCVDTEYLSKFEDLKDDKKDINVSASQSIRTYEHTFSVPVDYKDKKSWHLKDYQDDLDGKTGKPINEYKIIVKANFCTARNQEHSDCIAWKGTETVLENKFSFETGFTNNAQLDDTLASILNIVNNMVMPALWIILGVLLIVRGVILGIQIVKSSDEPDVRKQKINGLIWLFIGIFVAYVITISASLVMSFFGYGGIF